MKKISNKAIALLAVMMLLVGSFGLAYATDGGGGEGNNLGEPKKVEEQQGDQKVEPKSETKPVEEENNSLIKDESQVEGESQVESENTAEEITFSNANYRFPPITTGWTPVENDKIATKADPGKANDIQLSFSNVTEANKSTFFADKIVVKKEEMGAITGYAITTTGTLGRLRVQIPVSTLEENSSYFVEIDKSITGTLDNRIIKFETGEASAPPPSVSFSAIFSYPVVDSKNVETNMPIVIEFSREVKRNTITKDSVILMAEQTEIGVNPVLDAGKKLLTITPTSELKHGTDYVLTLKEDIKSDDGTESIPANTSLKFSTKAFNVKSIEASLNSQKTTLSGIKVNLENLSGESKTANIKVEIRRDLGARIEEGGTATYINSFRKEDVLVGEQSLEIDTSNVDLTKDINNTSDVELKGKIFIDVYILDGKGNQIGNTFHKEL